MHALPVRLLFLLAIGLPAYAVAADDAIQAPEFAASCETYDGHYEVAPLMEVKPLLGATRVSLQNAARACPATGACPQKRKAFLVAGDQVFVSKEQGGFRCAYYGTAGGQLIAGFLPADSLADAREETVLTPAFLVGDWENGGDEISVSATTKGKVHAVGTAIWQGMDPMNVHEGGFASDAAVAGSEIVFQEEGCEVRAHRRGNYLLVDDNSECGGMNVRFHGIYVRKRAKSN